MDKSMSKILTKLLLQIPLSNKKGLNIDLIYSEIFEFLPFVHFFKDFQYKTFRHFLCFQIALAMSIFEVEKCSFFKQVRFSPEIDSFIISELRRQKCIHCRQNQWSDRIKKTLVRVDRSAQNPRGRHLYRPRCPFLGRLGATLDYAGSVALQAVIECPQRHEAGIFPKFK